MTLSKLEQSGRIPLSIVLNAGVRSSRINRDVLLIPKVEQQAKLFQFQNKVESQSDLGQAFCFTLKNHDPCC